MNNEELDSQLSAMFDDELPAPECELLARRLARDEGLKARWGRYAAIGACIRSELGAARAPGGEARVAGSDARKAAGQPRTPALYLHGGLAGRVSRMIAAEPPLLAGPGADRPKRLANPVVSRWWQPVAGGAVVAAGVAAAAILWLRAGSPDAPFGLQPATQAGAMTIAQGTLPIALRTRAPDTPAGPAAPGAAAAAAAAAAEQKAADSDSFVVPPPADAPSFAPPIELANFVVAHSEYSAPFLRRSVLSALIADEPGGGESVSPAPAAAAGAGGAARGARTMHAAHVEHAR